jgi:hypothetical protein
MKMAQKIFEGAVIINQGFEFTVKDLRIIDGVACFKGVCTAHKCNDSIRNTGYNGAGYAGNRLVYDWEEGI